MRLAWRRLFAAAVAACLAARFAAAEETALDRYVQREDPTYSWKIVRETPGDAGTQYLIELTSQTWRTEKDVDRPVWKHWLFVVRPKETASKIGFLFIGGGANGREAPAGADGRTMAIAQATGSVVAELRMVPNQPLEFHQDGVKRTEDDLIAYTWDQFLKTGDETWPARLPMVKSAVRAMDCIQELTAGKEGGGPAVEQFVVAGGSKRGWTTWCTAAVDKRVVAAVPIVIDVLNVAESMVHHAKAYGFYAEAVGDYMQHKIMQRRDHPRMKDLYAIEDPFSYRERLTMPKYIVNASGDQFFCPDSSQFYYDELPEEKLLRYVPNADHGLGGSDALESIIAFYWTVLKGTKRPKYSWTFEADGSIRVSTPDQPSQVLLWQANNPKARDFRVDTIGKAYTSTPLEEESPGVYVGRIEPPAAGWTAYFVELAYDVGAPAPLKVSTGVRVAPDRLPYADIDPAAAPYERARDR
jgi:PhoPQ-activated pathogenicity-related protein